MAKVVYAALKPKSDKSKRSVKKRVIHASGEATSLYTVDADSQTFGDDLTFVFQENVRKARRRNLKVVGAADRVPAKR
jgi:hypothetical protein